MICWNSGYPGYKAPRFTLAPRLPEPRSLFYRKTPGVEKYQSPVHELYMRPYNYVSYSMGGSKPVQYNYHYQTSNSISDYPSFSHSPVQAYQPSFHSPTTLPHPTPLPHIVHPNPTPLAHVNHQTSAPHHSPSLPSFHASPAPFIQYSTPSPASIISHTSPEPFTVSTPSPISLPNPPSYSSFKKVSIYFNKGV